MMKKSIRTLALSAAALMLSAAFCQSVMAAPGKKNLGTAAKVNLDAVTVDGKKDAIYEKGLNIKTEVNNDVSADTWVVWSNGCLYFYADVTDATENDCDAATRTTAPWSADSIEIFIDDDNDGADYAMQYRVDFTGYGTWKDRNANINYYTPDVIGDDFQYAAVKTSTGYTAEMCVPLDGKVGNEVGFNIQINNVTSTSYLVENGWNTPEYYYFILGDIVKTDTPAESTDTGVASAPQTADPFAIAAVAAIASAAAAAVIKKKH